MLNRLIRGGFKQKAESSGNEEGKAPNALHAQYQKVSIIVIYFQRQ